jgi:protein-S-isoprenylcysteine O-methyltransferase Ste14
MTPQNLSTTHPNPLGRADVSKRIAAVLCFVGVQALLLFGAAGRLNWDAAWVYLAVYVGVLVLNAALIIPRHADLLAERAKVGENAKGWDRILVTFVGLIMPMAAFLTAGLDIRNGWTSDLGSGMQIGSLIITILGFALVTWSMVSNRFFSGVVRIQTDRGHTVATGGPYAIVRHPGYVGMIAFNVGIPLLLGSLVALIPAVINVGLFVLRTALEDRTLQRELPGYSDYAQRTRYRLMPSVW